MKYGIIGTGAIGGYYGAKLAKAGNDVHFLLHSDYDYVKEHGMKIHSCNGDFNLEKPQVYNSTESIPKCDVVLVCLKSVNNHLLKELLTPLLHKEIAVVLIQNGIGVEADVQKVFPQTALIAGLAFICCAKTEPGAINHQCYGSINLGNYSCKDTKKFQQIIKDFKDADVPTQEVEYNEARWKKAVWNMPFNGMTVALNTRTDLLLKNPDTRKLVKSLMMEVVNAANAAGVKNIDEAFADKMIENTLNMTPYSPSMKLDYDFKRKMEIYYLYTRPIEEAMKAGYEMKQLKMLEAELLFLEEKNLK